MTVSGQKFNLPQKRRQRIDRKQEGNRRKRGAGKERKEVDSNSKERKNP